MNQHARLPCPSPTPGVYSNSCPWSRECHPAISSSVVPFSSCPQSLQASGSFLVSQLFAWGGQSIGVSASASVFPGQLSCFFLHTWLILGPSPQMCEQHFDKMDPTTEAYGYLFTVIMGWGPLPFWPPEKPSCTHADREVFLDLRHLLSLL